MSNINSIPSPNLDEFILLINDKSNAAYNLFPIYQTINADLETPVSAYLKLTSNNNALDNNDNDSSNNNDNSFLLESVEGGEWQVRYSYIGVNPYKILRQDNVDPLIAIEQELSLYKPYIMHNLPDFSGGGVGYISYDSVSYFEPKVPKSNTFSNNTHNDKINNFSIPESIFMFCRSLVVFDHIQHTIKLISHVHINRDIIYDKQQLENLYNQAVNNIKSLLSKLSQPLESKFIYTMNSINPANINNTPNNEHKFESSGLESNVGQSGYENFVNSLKENILAGDIIQAVPSQRCSKQLYYASAFDIYRELRVVNPSPYMFYLKLDDLYIVGASPEQLVKVNKNTNIVTTHPIAGTRRRGRTGSEDLAMEKELLSSEKERAEHIMLVDLGRNDIGRIAAPGTVKVDSLMHIERYSHVMHIVSHVSGKLSCKHTIYDAFRSVFPAGTVSGAPKIRAMQLINQLENCKRGIYAGAVGFISYNGLLDTAIAIRTIVIKDNIAYLQAGGGIVYDAIPNQEYKETINKMKATEIAVNNAELYAFHRIVNNNNIKHNTNNSNINSNLLILLDKVRSNLVDPNSNNGMSKADLIDSLSILLASTGINNGFSSNQLIDSLAKSLQTFNQNKNHNNTQ